MTCETFTVSSLFSFSHLSYQFTVGTVHSQVEAFVGVWTDFEKHRPKIFWIIGLFFFFTLCLETGKGLLLGCVVVAQQSTALSVEGALLGQAPVAEASRVEGVLRMWWVRLHSIYLTSWKLELGMRSHPSWPCSRTTSRQTQIDFSSQLNHC